MMPQRVLRSNPACAFGRCGGQSNENRQCVSLAVFLYHVAATSHQKCYMATFPSCK
jgi:hypothetical protein